MNKRKMQRLYVHVPFCARKCDYCAFYSEPAPDEAHINAYLNRLEEEFKSNSVLCTDLKSIYIGGGTPSLLNTAQLSRLFAVIRENFSIAEKAEISIECNPESLSAENVPVIANFANRISVGVQSFNCEFRKTIGRAGKTEAIAKAFDLLNSHGMDNIGCDLIYAIPGETLADWAAELKQAVCLPVKHISAYSLTFEEGTKLCKTQNPGKEFNCDDYMETEAVMWEFTDDFLDNHNFSRYEVSNYSQPGYTCQHNEGIWFGEPYLGCGPSASSFDGKLRWTNRASIKKWLAKEKPEYDSIPEESRAREIFVMGLRTVQGWDVQVFYECTGYNLSQWSQELKTLVGAGLISWSPQKIKCTAKGLLLWNEIAETLI